MGNSWIGVFQCYIALQFFLKTIIAIEHEPNQRKKKKKSKSSKLQNKHCWKEHREYLIICGDSQFRYLSSRASIYEGQKRFGKKQDRFWPSFKIAVKTCLSHALFIQWLSKSLVIKVFRKVVRLIKVWGMMDVWVGFQTAIKKLEICY